MKPAKTSTAICALLAWSLAISATVNASEGVDRLEIVDRAIAYHGGDIYGASETRLDVCSKSGCFRVETRAGDGHFDFLVSGKAGGVQREVRSQGGATTVELDGQAIVVEADRLQPYIDWAMARIYFCFLPHRLNDPGVYKQDLGLTTWKGRQLHRVKVTFEPGSSTDASDEYMYWFDPETARLEYFAYTYDDNGGGLRFRRAVAHRRLSGILLFDQENLGTEGAGLTVDAIDEAYVRDQLRHVSTVRLENIEVRPVR